MPYFTLFFHLLIFLQFLFKASGSDDVKLGGGIFCDDVGRLPAADVVTLTAGFGAATSSSSPTADLAEDLYRSS